MYSLYFEMLLRSLAYNGMHLASICFLFVGMLPIWRGMVNRCSDRDMCRAFGFLAVCFILMLISINAIEVAKAAVRSLR